MWWKTLVAILFVFVGLLVYAMIRVGSRADRHSELIGRAAGIIEAGSRNNRKAVMWG